MKIPSTIPMATATEASSLIQSRDRGSSKGVTRVILAIVIALLATVGPTLAVLSGPPPVEVAREELGGLNVEPPHSMNGYSRAKFPQWAIQYGECDTREVVLQRDGTGTIQDDKCRTVHGTWYSKYDGKTLSNVNQVDIDLVVPLTVAWRSGADRWDTATRKAFANDLEHYQLVAVSATSNRSKGDQTPDLWKPPLRSFWCTYSRAYIDVKHVYKLSVTEAEKKALGEMLDTCSAI